MEKSLREKVADLRLQRDIVNLQISRLQETCRHSRWKFVEGNFGYKILDPGDEYLECVECGKVK